MRRNTPPDRLSRDAAAARAAGQSYGMWKASHPHTSEDPEPEEALLDDGRRELTCQRCGKVFVAYGQEARRKYCSDECRAKAQYETFRQRHPIPMVPCIVCGREFQRRSGRKYCSESCRRAENRIQQAKRNAMRPTKRKEKENG